MELHCVGWPIRQEECLESSATFEGKDQFNIQPKGSQHESTRSICWFETIYQTPPPSPAASCLSLDFFWHSWLPSLWLVILWKPSPNSLFENDAWGTCLIGPLLIHMYTYIYAIKCVDNTYLYMYVHTYIHTIPFHSIPSHPIPLHYLTLPHLTLHYITYTHTCILYTI